jgi:protein-L-isoaspartate(D-aspartate) O-methyltransferase
VSLQYGDGWEGLPDAGPFNAIHVGAAAAKFPKPLMQQLAVGGVMVIPVGPDGGVQSLYRVQKVKDSAKFDEDDYVIKNLLGVRYVPLFHP